MKAHNFIDLTGQRFGKLVVLKRADNGKHNQARWLCRCDCGKDKTLTTSSLKSGDTKSCGCLKRNCWIRKDRWKEEDDNILNQFYHDKGTKYCANKLNRTMGAINVRAMKLCLKTTIINGGLPRKIIIKKISNNKVLSLCKIHGETTHHYYKNKIQYCIKCCVLTSEQKRRQNERFKKYRENPVNRLAYNLRSLLWNSFNRISKNNNTKTKGCFRNLDYTPLQLYNYLQNIKNLQNNKCPHCNISYNECEISIDHVIPLKKAKTEQEVIDLFDLKNLNLMCRSCNSSKNSRSYSVWKDSKYVIK